MKQMVRIVALEKEEAGQDSWNHDYPSAVFLNIAHVYCLILVGIRLSLLMACDAARESNSTGQEVKSGVLNE